MQKGLLKPERERGRTALRPEIFTEEQMKAILEAFPIDLTDDVKTNLEKELNEIARQYQIEVKFIDERPLYSERKAQLQSVLELSQKVISCCDGLDAMTLTRLGLSVEDAENTKATARSMLNRAKCGLKEEEKEAKDKGKARLKEPGVAIPNAIDRLGSLYLDVTGRNLRGYRDETNGRWKDPFTRVVKAFLHPFDSHIRTYESIKKRVSRRIPRIILFRRFDKQPT